MVCIKSYLNRYGKEVEMIRQFQEQGMTHSLTCGNPAHDDEQFSSELYPTEVSNGVILRCHGCDYIQIVDDGLLEVIKAGTSSLFRYSP